MTTDAAGYPQEFPRGDTSDQLASRLKTQLQQCAGFDGDEMSNAREAALDAYFQRPRGDEKAGRAGVVSGDISAMVDATVATMIEALKGDRIADFDPMGPEDEDQAQLESDAVSYYVLGRENGFLQLTTAIKEALLLRNGVIKCDAEMRTQLKTSRLGNVDPDALPELIDGDDVEFHDYDPTTGELSVTRRVTTKEFVMYSVSLENFIYHSEWHNPTLGDIPICAERHVDTRADMIERGFNADLVMSLTEHRHPLKPETHARNPRSKTYTTTAIDKSQQLVEWFEVYVHMGVGLEGGQHASELRRVCMHYVDGKILENIPVSRIRLAAGTCFINPHRFTGISLFDKLKQTQDMRTGLRRALMDNVNAVNKARLAGIDGVVNKDDVASPRVNNLVRVKKTVADVRTAIMPIVTQDTSANILANLESTARERSEMGGSALDLQTASMQIGGDRMGSEGLDRAYSVAETLSAAMMSTLAATLIRDVFLLAHATLREYFDEPLPIKRNGKWQNVTPSTWPERKSVTIKPGMSPGERGRRLTAQAEILNSQMMLADKGMDEVLVNLGTFNRALLDYARLAEVQNPEQYYLDPESPESQAALKRKSEARQMDDMARKALMQQAFGLEQMRTALAKYQGDADRQLEYFKAVLDAEVEEGKIAGGVVGDILAKLQAKGLERANTSGETTVRPGAETEPVTD